MKENSGKKRADLTRIQNDVLMVSAERREELGVYQAHELALSAMANIDRRSANQVRSRTIEYLRMCGEHGMRPTVTGYALALGTSRAGLLNMMRSKTTPPDVSEALETGLTMIEDSMLQMMMDSKTSPVAYIFLLKNHFGYSDQTDITIRADARNDGADEAAIEAKYMTIMDVEAHEVTEREESPAARALREDIEKHYGEA